VAEQRAEVAHRCKTRAKPESHRPSTSIAMQQNHRDIKSPLRTAPPGHGENHEGDDDVRRTNRVDSETNSHSRPAGPSRRTIDEFPSRWPSRMRQPRSHPVPPRIRPKGDIPESHRFCGAVFCNATFCSWKPVSPEPQGQRRITATGATDIEAPGIWPVRDGLLFFLTAGALIGAGKRDPSKRYTALCGSRSPIPAPQHPQAHGTISVAQRGRKKAHNHRKRAAIRPRCPAAHPWR